MTLDLAAIQAELEDRIKMTEHHPDTVPTFMWVLQEHLAREEELPVITGVVTPDQLWAMLGGLERDATDDKPVRVAVDCIISVTPRPPIDYTKIVGEVFDSGPLQETAEQDPGTDMATVELMPWGTGLKDGWVLSCTGAEPLRVPVSDLAWSMEGEQLFLRSRFHEDLTDDERTEWVGRIREWLESVGRTDVKQGPLK